MTELITQTGVPHWLQPPKLDRSDFYPERVWEDILMRMMAGETISSVCKDPTMPEYRRLIQWIYQDEERKNRYYEARAIGAETVEDELLSIADGDGDGVPNEVQRDTLRIQTRKYLLGVWNRKRYGDTKTVDHNVKLDLSEAMEQAAARINNQNEKVIEHEGNN